MEYNQVLIIWFMIFNIYSFTCGFLSVHHDEQTCEVLSPFYRQGK